MVWVPVYAWFFELRREAALESSAASERDLSHTYYFPWLPARKLSRDAHPAAWSWSVTSFG